MLRQCQTRDFAKFPAKPCSNISLCITDKDTKITCLILFIAGTSTFVVPSTPRLSTLPLIGGQSIQAAPNGHVVIAGTMLSPGKPGLMVSGTPITLGPSGLIIGSSTYAVPAPSSMQLFLP